MGLTQLTQRNQSRDSCNIKSEEVMITKMRSKFTNRARPKVLASIPWRRLKSLHGVLFLTLVPNLTATPALPMLGIFKGQMPYSIKLMLRILTKQRVLKEGSPPRPFLLCHL